jgi:hypothetical protein
MTDMEKCVNYSRIGERCVASLDCGRSLAGSEWN